MACSAARGPRAYFCAFRARDLKLSGRRRCSRRIRGPVARAAALAAHEPAIVREGRAARNPQYPAQKRR